MKKSKFTEQQIGFALKQAEAGEPAAAAAEVCRKMEVSEAMFFEISESLKGERHPVLIN